MKISYHWLKEYLLIDEKVEEVSELLTNLGLEVEAVEEFETVKGGLKGVVVGQVMTCVAHPNADKLKVTTVDVGAEEPLQIVCGAPNVAADQKVPVATVGTLLYDGDKKFKIKKSKIRGEVSMGMICAEDELGLGTSHDGIMVLDTHLQVGTSLTEIFDIQSDSVFEIGLTPNRSDAMSYIGVARDLYAGFKMKGKTYPYSLPKYKPIQINKENFPLNVKVEDTDLCPRYAGVVISDIQVVSSPKWLQNRLKSIGLTPINNVVDVTNFVLHELGQPLHAFDLGKIKGNTVIVRRAHPKEKFTTLDDVERQLHCEDLVIADQRDIMCIAGVFGGIYSGVTDNTTSIFLESAYFDAISIRKTSKRYGLNTDASFRFERGIDPNITLVALQRAVSLIVEVTGGKLSSDIYDHYPNPIADFQVEFCYARSQRLIGKEIPLQQMKSILESLDISVVAQNDTLLTLNVPAYRVDVRREADVIEEILRVYGYNNVEFSEKLNISVSYADKYNSEKMAVLVSDYLSANGFSEMMANSLTKASYTDLLDKLNPNNMVSMMNPLSSDLAVMRQSMLFSGLEAIAHNINRKNTDLKLFELGKIYHKHAGTYQESKHLSIFITGNRTPANWSKAQKPSDFYDIKSVVECILSRLGIKDTKFAPCKSDVFLEGIAIKSGKQTLVEVGLVKNTILNKMGIKQTVLYADLNWDVVLERIKDNRVQYTELPKYPEVRRDLALLLDENVKFDQIYTLAHQTEKNILKKVNLFDVYQGDKLPKGKKSYAVSFVLQDETKTLTDKCIDRVMGKIQQTIEKHLNAQLRQ